MVNFGYTIWILILPFFMFLLLGLAGHKLKPKLSGLLGTIGLGIITVLSYVTAYKYFFTSEKVEEAFQKLTAFNSVWLQLTENLHIDMGILLDPISVMMLIVVTTVSFMVHIYSIGYMHGEKGFERFFAFLSLFTFSMLGLVVATNIFQMYIFWELVGVSSYLLIGFYYTKPSAVRASKKAFIVTRFADMGFLIGILILSFNTKTFDFITLTSLSGPAITQTGGAAAAPDALEVVAYVGAFSSLLAAVIACTQTDIKRVLAYSTMSQIGYMMLALGVSGYGGHEGLGYMASMFHLFTHAMFKALLFLGAGAIIHAVHSNYMTEMGGLRKYLPITHATFLIACLTIAGVPPLSGFFSKDEILTAALHNNKLLFAVEYAVAGLTAFYMFRLYFSIFWGKDRHYHHTPHEAPLTMTIPLMILAIGSVLSGFIPFSKLVTSDGLPFESHIEMAVAIPSVLIGLAGILIAYIMYSKETAIPDKLATTFNYSYKWAYNKFYIDEVYLFVTKKIIFRHISTPIAWFDRHIVDGTMNLIALVTQLVSFRIRGFQSGQLQKYGYVFVTGAIALAIIFIYLWK
ncbi:MAG: NADH-quinone oxidoreductase subunit L [Bacteroidia bacterium]|nr:NADH-quinone oxidoreductase subunit L [Bacteroidia bacterium]